MVYLLCSAFSVLIFIVTKYTEGKSCGKLSHDSNKVLLFLPFVYWVVLIGSQYYVGTDYPTYYSYFLTGDVDLYWYKKEYLFALIAETIYKYRLNPQLGFVVFAFLQFAFLCLFVNKYKFKRYDLLLFVYFFCGTVFINQTNAVRQYTSMYIFLFSIIYIYKRQFIRYLLFVILAAMFHKSALFLVLFYFLNFLLKKYSIKLFSLYTIITVILIFTGIDFFAIKIVERTIYEGYLNTSYFLDNNRMGYISLITKLIYLPFYLRLFGLNIVLNDKEKYFIHFGSVCYCIKLISMSSFFLGRFAMYVDFLSYIPFYYYMLYLVENKNINKNYRLFELFVFLSFTIGPYLVKVLIFPNKEYIYNSVLFPYL